MQMVTIFQYQHFTENNFEFLSNEKEAAHVFETASFFYWSGTHTSANCITLHPVQLELKCKEVIYIVKISIHSFLTANKTGNPKAAC